MGYSCVKMRQNDLKKIHFFYYFNLTQLFKKKLCIFVSNKGIYLYPEEKIISQKRLLITR